MGRRGHSQERSGSSQVLLSSSACPRAWPRLCYGQSCPSHSSAGWIFSAGVNTQSDVSTRGSEASPQRRRGTPFVCSEAAWTCSVTPLCPSRLVSCPLLPPAQPLFGQLETQRFRRPVFLLGLQRQGWGLEWPLNVSPQGMFTWPPSSFHKLR